MRLVYERAATDIRAKGGAGSAAWRFDVRNASAPVADVWIYDEISQLGVTADAFQATLAGITAREINLHVHSPGGNVFDAIAIYNSLRYHPARVTARVEGLAASAASIIVQAADKRVMMDHSQMMIHNTRVDIMNASAAEMDEIKDLLLRQDNVLAGIYHERTKGGAKKLEKILAAMSAETWFTAEEAVAFRLADSVESPKFQGEPTDAEGDEEEDVPVPDEEDDDEETPPFEEDEEEETPEDEDAPSGDFDSEFDTLMSELSDNLEALV
jgi:ATP-dependent protease ClpP protease subunit